MAFIYLASPYTDKSKLIMHDRYIAVSKVTANYLRRGIHVYSPIVHCHELAKRYQFPRDFDFWMNYNFSMLECASHLHVLQLPGWKESRGIKEEVRCAMRRNIPYTMLPHPSEVTD